MTPRQVLKFYSLPKIVKIDAIKEGLIHRTYKVKTEGGIFVLQKVSFIFKPSINKDTQAALAHLKGNSFEVMEILANSQGKLYVKDGKYFWRVTTYIDGKVYGKTFSPQLAYEAGYLLGKYHKILNSKFKYQFKHFRTIKHNIPLVYQKYRSAVKKTKNRKVIKLGESVNLLPSLFLPKNLRKSVIHGDPKISNFIFSYDKKPKAISMVDFDDCGNRHSVLYELGSAFRSWSEVARGRCSMFDLKRFQAALSGYDKGSSHFLSKKERKLIPRAIKIQTLQLTSRFLRDYFEDYYFAWNPRKYSSRKAHNLDRAKDSIELYNDIVRKEKKIKELIGVK